MDSFFTSVSVSNTFFRTNLHLFLMETRLTSANLIRMYPNVPHSPNSFADDRSTNYLLPINRYKVQIRLEQENCSFLRCHRSCIAWLSIEQRWHCFNQKPNNLIASQPDNYLTKRNWHNSHILSNFGHLQRFDLILLMCRHGSVFGPGVFLKIVSWINKVSLFIPISV